MTYYLISGEASGDLHGSNLMKALKQADAEARFRFCGGEMMQAVGGELVRHYRDMAYMGFLSVLLHARTLLHILDLCKKDILATRPDVLILIDFPGFNLKIARFVKTHAPEIHVCYYISPKLWAWKQYRIKALRRYVDRMLCILPFETAFYEKLDYKATYVGNPSVDAVGAYLATADDASFRLDNGLPDKPLLALLAGSRKTELKANLPLMLEAAKRLPDYQAVIAGAPGLTADDYRNVVSDTATPIVFGQTYALLHHASAALVTSGTATLETALFRVPQTVCYFIAGGMISNFIFRHFFHVPFISLVNLIAGREIVKELMGGRFTLENVLEELRRITGDQTCRQRMLDGYDDVIASLGYDNASTRAASEILSLVRN
jgi:lipid-A-disaccharide synthase